MMFYHPVDSSDMALKLLAPWRSKRGERSFAGSFRADNERRG